MEKETLLMDKAKKILVDNRARLVFVLLVYGFFFIGVTGFYTGFFSITDNGFTTYKETNISPSSTPSSFSISFIASATQDLLFFLIVGLIVFSLGQKDPKEEDLMTKIKHIFPGVKPGTPLSNHLKEQINLLSCISPKVSRHVTIDEYCPEKNAFKVYTKTITYVKNIHINEDYATDEMKFSVTADEVAPQDGIYGQILDVSIIYDVTGSDKSIHHKEGVVTLTSTEPYVTNFSLKLIEEQEAMYQVHIWVWQAANKSIRFGARRFTEHEDVTFINKSNVDLKINDVQLNKHRGEHTPAPNTNIQPGNWSTYDIKIVEQEDSKPNDVEKNVPEQEMISKPKKEYKTQDIDKSVQKIITKAQDVDKTQ